MRILLVEDDRPLARELVSLLQRSNFVVDVCESGLSARDREDIASFDAAVLDLGLPDIDGVAVLSAWRARSQNLPVLILTARDRFSDLVAGFKSGADDYLKKPFRNEELILRLFALIRRGAGHAQTHIDVGGLSLETASGTIALNGLPLRLTAFEGRVLRYLMHRRDAVVSRTELSEHVYGEDIDRDFNSLEVVVSRLRKKIGAVRIESIRGEGYVLRTCEDA
ncbi:response regulator transcription factor [Pseudorhodoplanes sp.]|uniref:response regulator transcription factor n=1 Tax=Pseudorhodoplanes sp. TaxID=1934341 RepID=UPI003918CFEA